MLFGMKCKVAKGIPHAVLGVRVVADGVEPSNAQELDGVYSQ